MTLIQTLEEMTDLVIDEPGVLAVNAIIDWRGQEIRITVQLEKNTKDD